MPWLDAFPAVFHGAAAAIFYRDGVLRKYARADDSQGGGTLSSTDYPVKVQVDSATLAMRSEPGYAPTDVRLLILSHGVAADIGLDDKVQVGSTWYRVTGGISRDPANVYWDVRGAVTTV